VGAVFLADEVEVRVDLVLAVWEVEAHHAAMREET
jgi:hypothetical protein